jgi:hypothetical protein
MQQSWWLRWGGVAVVGLVGLVSLLAAQGLVSVPPFTINETHPLRRGLVAWYPLLADR